MWNKNNTTWKKEDNFLSTDLFERFLKKLKTYSKCINSATYSVTNTLEDVYNILKYQHAFWVSLTNFADDTIEFMGITLEKGNIYNMLDYFSCDTLSKSSEFRELLEKGYLKAANSLLFEDIINPTREEWFNFYEPKRINQYINLPFDFLVIRYKLKDVDSRDIDTRTALIDTNYSGAYLENGSLQNPNNGDPTIDGNDIGWARGNSISSTSGAAYLEWGGDNTTSSGGEAILVDFKQIAQDLSYLETINVRLRAFFYAVLGDGKIEMELATYSGGSMQKDVPNRDFINVGGSLTQSVTVDRKILTQISSNIDGDELGTVVYNTENSNALITNIQHNVIESQDLSFSELLSYIDFDLFEWQMGTSGYDVDDPNYIDMIISPDFNCEEIKDFYQSSTENLGYTQRNVFTSNKTFEKLLKNYHVIDVASNNNIDIYDENGDEIFYVTLDIDGVKINNQRILLKNQNDIKENGVYYFSNNILIRDEILETVDDIYYFSCFIKEGEENKNKEFFINRKNNGEYPSFEEGFIFSEGNNYVLRNRSSYKLLADHVFNSSDYFTEESPIISIDYNNNVTNSSLIGTDFFNINLKYELSTDLKELFIYDVNNSLVDTIDVEPQYTFLSKLDNNINFAFYIQNNNDSILYTYDSINSESIKLKTLTGIVKDFNIFDDLIIYITNDNSNNKIIKESAGTNTSILTEYTVDQDAQELSYFETGLGEFIFYSTSEKIYLKYNNVDFFIKNVENPTNLYSNYNISTLNITLSWLVDGVPEKYIININELVQLLSWEKDDDYELEFFSKTKIDDWEIIDNELYLKETQITNLGTNSAVLVPRISKGDRLYDGLDDFSTLPVDSLSKIINGNGSFTIDFKTTPNNLRVNQPVFYFGNTSELITFKFRLFQFTFQLPPTNYITFYVNDVDDFPYFVISQGGKTLTVKSNKKLQIGKKTSVTFTWNYTNNKATGTLYFDGIDVGNVIDQRVNTTGLINEPLNVRNINFERMYIADSEFTSSPLYEGYLSDFRIWNIALNPTQVFTRKDKEISTSDILYSNLIAYWKLTDFNSLHTDLISSNNGIFFGGLNLDPLLLELNDPRQIQLNNDNLYVLDDKKITSSTSGFNIDLDLNIFDNETTVENLIVEDPFNSSNSVQYLPTNTYGSYYTSKVKPGDVITGQVDILVTPSTSGTSFTIPDNGLLYYNMQDSNGSFLRRENAISVEWFSETATLINTWETIDFSYTVPDDLTYDGTNFTPLNDINLEVSTWVPNANEPAYFDNFYITINRHIPQSDLYKIILFNEKIEKLYESIDGIKSIYLENDFIYFLENNDIKYYNNTTQNIDVLYSNDFIDLYNSNLQIRDFTIVNTKPYILRENNIIYDENNNVIYESDFSNIKTLYGKEQTNINKLNLYWKENDDSINLLSDSTTSGTNFQLEYIATYPFENNNNVDIIFNNGTSTVINSYEIVNNRVIENSNLDLDINNNLWSINLKEIFGVYSRNSRLLIGVKTINNNIQVWMYNPKNSTSIRFADKDLNPNFFTTSSNVDMSYNNIGDSEFLTFIDSTNNKILWYKIEHDNKISYDYLPHEYAFETNNNLEQIQYFSDTKYWLLLNNKDKFYLSTVNNTNNNYNLWYSDLEFTKKTKGWITGESGLLFDDNFNEPWELDFNNIIFKDDFNDIHVSKTNSLKELGYTVKEWSNKSWLVGNRGRIIRSFDAGTSFEVLNSGVLSDLTSVSFIDDNDGLIVGLNNTILSTFSGGDSFIKVNLPESIGNRSWSQIIYYKTDNAILVGTNGTIIHLSRSGQNWRTSKILNNLELSELNIQIKQKDLDDFIKLEYQIDNQSDIYNGTINSIHHIKNNEFMICGDNNMIGYLNLVPKLGYFEPHFNFYSSQISSDWNQIVSYNDIVRNEKRAFVLDTNIIYTFEWNRFNIGNDTNIQPIILSEFYKHDRKITHINFWDDNYLISIGERVNVLRHDLFKENEISNPAYENTTSGTSGLINVFVDDLTLEEENLKDFFTPKLLFTDYYMGRKINIHLEDGSFEKPTSKVPKSLLECFYFRHGESISFTDYGTVDNQNNFLAYQDYYYLNRRLLDGGLNKWGKMQDPYNKYNKKITAIDNWKEISTFEANSCEGVFGSDGTNGIVCIDNLLQEGDFSKSGIEWTQDNSEGVDSWVFTAGKARVSKSVPFGASGSYILKQNISLFKNIKHVFKFNITNTGGNYDINIWGYKGLAKDLLGSKTNPSPTDVIEFTPITDYNAFGVSITYQGLLLQTITLDDLSIDKDDDAFRIFNDVVTDVNEYTSGLFEESKATKIQIDPSTLKVDKGDVIRITVTEIDKDKLVKEGDTLFYRIQNEALEITKKAIVTNDILDFDYFTIDSITQFNKTVQDIEDEVLSKSIELSNQILLERCMNTVNENRSINVENLDEYLINTQSVNGIYVEETQKVYIPTFSGGNRLVIIDTITRNITNNVSLPNQYETVTYNKDNGFLYLSGSSSNSVLIIDASTELIVTTINTTSTPNAIDYNISTNLVYTYSTTETFIIKDETIVETLPFGSNSGLLSMKSSVQKDETMFIKSGVFGDEKLRVVEGTNYIQDIVIPTTISSSLADILYVEDNDRIYLSSGVDNRVYVINPNNYNVISTINLNQDAYYMEYVPNNNKLYISNSDFGTNEEISIINLETNTFEKSIDTDIDVRAIKYNPIEDLVYLAGQAGDIVLMEPNTEEILELNTNVTVDGGVNTFIYEPVFGYMYSTKTNYNIVNIFKSTVSYNNSFKSEIGKLIVDETSIVREYLKDTQTITIWDLFDDSITEDCKNGRILLQNLNYFNGDLIHLEEVFKTHLVGQSYELNVREKDNLIIDGYVNDYTKYYNLESYVTFNVYGGTNSTSGILNEYTYPIEYSEDVIYGPNYNLLTFLQNINSTAFVGSYEFDMPEETYTYNTLKRNGLGEFVEFSIDKSQIFVGEELSSILKFEDGIFVDIITNTNTIKKVHINSITETRYKKYPDKKRYIIQTDHVLDELGITFSGNITIRSRNRLDEISRDLEFTDDVMFPITNQSTSGHAIEYQYRSYFKQVRTATKYSKVILNDDLIRKYVTGVVWLDDENDWNINVIDWKTDPNFYYRPIEIHEVGVDNILKKAISVDSSNYFIDGDRLGLTNIDFNRFNYKLVDLLTVEKLENDYFWILNAEIKDAVIGQGSDGELIWYQGDWLCGTWENGIWYSGRAFNIEWLNGEVFSYKINNNFNLIEVVPDDNPENTIWYNANWIQGIWNNGVWFNGIWNTGSRFSGIWYDGTWNGGIWENGEFRGGTWVTGTWLAGEFSEDNAIAVWQNGTWLGGDFANGLWLNGIWDQTDRVESRFGTRSTLLHNAVWEYGYWKNGQFHSGLTVDNNNNPIASINYSNSIWKNGIWEKGNWYGGTWEMGRWNNGNWYNGYWKSNLNIKELRYKEKEFLDTDSLVEVEFTSQHYFKNVNDQNNYFIVLGEPEIEFGNIHPNTELLGYNMNPVRHDIVNIVNDTTVLISIPDKNFPFSEDFISSTSGSSGLIDTTPPKLISTDITTGMNVPVGYEYVPSSGKLYITHSASDNVVSVDVNTEVASTVFNSTSGIGNPIWNYLVNEVYIPSSDNNVIYTLNPLTDTFIGQIYVESAPSDIEIVPSTFKVYSTNPDDDSVSSINPGTKISTRISIPGSNPHSLQIANGLNLYITCPDLNQVKVINSTTDIVTNTINVGTNPTLMALDSNSSHLYVVNVNSGNIGFTIINSSTKIVIGTLNIGHTINSVKYDTTNDVILCSTTNGLYIIKDMIIIKHLLSSVNVKDAEFYPDFDYLMVLNGDNNKAVPFDINNNYSIVLKDEVNLDLNATYLKYVDNNETVWSLNLNSNKQLTKIIKYDEDIAELEDCEECKDYTLLVLDIDQYFNIPFKTLNYVGNPEIASHWLDGSYNQGIWEYGWFNNGNWTGGIWLDGVFENGLFGS